MMDNLNVVIIIFSLVACSSIVTAALFFFYTTKSPPQQQRKTSAVFDTLVLSGGGAYGIAYAGVCRYLEEANYLQNIHRFVGASAGALVSTMLALRIPVSEIEHYVTNLPLWNKILEKRSMDLFRASFVFLKNHKTRFRDLEPGIDLSLVGMEFESQRIQIFSRKTTPDVLVIDALCAAICQPRMFEGQVLIENKKYIDGALIYNLPIAEAPGPRTLAVEINLNPDFENWTGSPPQMMRYLSKAATGLTTQIRLDHKQVEATIVPLVLPYTEHLLYPETTEKVQSYVKEGYDTMQRYFF